MVVIKMDWKHLNSRLVALLKKICREADSAGIPAFLVGGFVRDLMLRRENWDIDIVLEGDAVAFARRWEGRGVAVTVHPQFRTATLLWPDGTRVDFSSARAEEYPRPGALPVVRPGTLREDLFRRDFTINAMALGLNGERAGVLVDYFGGEQDLRRGKVRILHDRSFIDDPTRILRAVCFEQRFNFRLESRTIKKLKEAVASDVISAVKPPRWFGSLRKILTEEKAGACLRRLQSLGALAFLDEAYVLPVRALARVDDQMRKLSRGGLYRPDWRAVYLMVVTEGIPVSRRLLFARQYGLTVFERGALLAVDQAIEANVKLRRPGLAASAVYRILSSCSLETISFIRVRTSANIVRHYVDHYVRVSRNVHLTLTGDDVQRLGCPAGPAVGRCLQELLDRKMDGELTTKADERRAAVEIVRQLRYR